MKKIFLILLICITILTGCDNTKEDSMQIVENNGMLSYTIDGEKTDIKPSKEDGYIVNKIVCDNGTDMMWDNDNWEIELTKVSSKDRCMVDFTKDVNAPGYRVTVTSNSPSSLDSLSKATTENGTIKIYSSSIVESVTECNGVINGNKVIINNVNSNQTCNIIIDDKTLAGVIKSAYPPKPGRTDFSVIDDGIPGLYTESDDQGTTYYFSGDGTSMKNWVKFADKWWRIIRINGNGSVRLLYAGDGNEARDVPKGAGYNSKANHPMYVGWRYEGGNSLESNRENTLGSQAYSDVKSWYVTNIVNKNLDNSIDYNAIYCNDRGENGTYLVGDDTSFKFNAYLRLIDNKTPTFKCGSENDEQHEADMFSGNVNINGENVIPVGLITADEASFAGGGNFDNAKAYYYLNKKAEDESIICTGTSGDPCSIVSNYAWWTMTPSDMNFVRTGDYGAGMFYINGSGAPGRVYTANLNGAAIYLRPVISLKKEVIVTGGDGSGNDPYTVAMP